MLPEEHNVSIRHHRIIRLFISSTFNDLKQERHALQLEVFPYLEDLCEKNQFQFQAIDLRWGVSGEAGLHHQAMQICFEELRRSQDVSPKPNFLILLGNRYGWRPLPEAISTQEFQDLSRAAVSLDEEVAELLPAVDGGPLPETATVPEKVTWQLRQHLRGKTASEVFSEWYLIDKNILVPDPGLTDPDHVPLNYILQPRIVRDGLDYRRRQDDPTKDTPEWMAVQEVLWAIINAVFAPAPAESKAGRFASRFDDINWPRHIAEVHDPKVRKRAVPQIVRFQGSATEQEIWCGALSADGVREHVFAFFRDINPNQTIKEAEILNDYFDGQVDPDHPAVPQEVDALTALKQELRTRLGDNAVPLKPAADLIPTTDARGRRTATSIPQNGSSAQNT